MSSPFLGQILASMIGGTRPTRAPEVPLEPIVPGAWAAWANAARESAADEKSEAVPTTSVTARRIDLVPSANS
jgi:hypothetical protein